MPQLKLVSTPNISRSEFDDNADKEVSLVEMFLPIKSLTEQPKEENNDIMNATAAASDASFVSLAEINQEMDDVKNISQEIVHCEGDSKSSVDVLHFKNGLDEGKNQDPDGSSSILEVSFGNSSLPHEAIQSLTDEISMNKTKSGWFSQ